MAHRHIHDVSKTAELYKSENYIYTVHITLV
jgi:hypothetical protein